MIGARDTVVTVRLDPGSVHVLDMLVGSGVARSRSEATARLVQIGIGASGSLLEHVREVANRARSLREEFGSAEVEPVQDLDQQGAVAIDVADDAADQVGRRGNDEEVTEDAVLPLPYQRVVQAVQNIGPHDELDVFAAAAIGDKDRVVALIEREPSLVSSHDENGWTPLHLASLFDRYRTAQSLIGLGADPSARSANGLSATPLHAAAYGRSELVADVLFLNRADMNARQANSWTPLHVAAFNGAGSMVDVLIRNRADPSLRTGRGETPFDLAMRRGHSQLAERLSNQQARRR